MTKENSFFKKLDQLAADFNKLTDDAIKNTHEEFVKQTSAHKEEIDKFKANANKIMGKASAVSEIMVKNLKEAIEKTKEEIEKTKEDVKASTKPAEKSKGKESKVEAEVETPAPKRKKKM